MKKFSSVKIPQSIGSDRKGVALVMVLWVITILSVVVLEFCFAMRTEVNITRNYQEDIRLYAVARGTVERTLAELIFKHDARVQQLRRTPLEGEVPPENREWVTDGREYRVSFEGAEGIVRVTGESGKVNLNNVSDSMLRRIMAALGLEGEARDIVVDSIQDWRDPDDFVRVNGAENEYYQSLKEPYDCKNGNFDSVEELMLVRGITPDLFYGKKPKSQEAEESQEEPVGLKDIFSIYAAGEQVDINSASLPVLRVVLGLPVEVSRQIILAREEKAFENLPDLVRRVPEIVPLLSGVQRLILFRAGTPYYTIEARGKSKEGGAGRGIRAVVKVDSQGKNGYMIVQWMDSMR
ncbi:MAG: general secretion pathway protein GspK [Syntrophaceae bacterium]|nr:general secretion pathway protein GspK [Syntrophaceae bacterium]